jgi:beta-glucosidase
MKQNTRGNITVRFDVKNTGAREGDEVAQLYTRDLVSSVTTYEKNLRGFDRVHLKPGESRTVTFTLTPEDLSLWDRDMRFVLEPGMFKIMIGASSEDIRLTGEFSIESN